MVTSPAPDADLRIQAADWHTDQNALCAIRQAVFIDEQGVPASLEWDGQDADSIHFIARTGDNAVGCIRLLPSGQISRLSVLQQYRHQGIGRSLLDAVENEAQVRGMPEIFLHAQTQATHFYEAGGFSGTGGIFVEAGIPHRQMFKDLR